jgi:CheY-like chemotaxis protein
MPQGGRLEIETKNEVLESGLPAHSGLLPPGEYVRLSVTDTGTGMDEGTRERIFEPFFTTKEAHQGTGLGLASVHEIVLQSGGQIDVEASSQVGSRFTAYFPVAKQTSEMTAPKAQRLRSRGRETILLVEDSAPVRRLVQRTLEKSGYTVLAAESATAALRHCGRHQGSIELLLTDVVLPRTDGPEIARRASELRPGIRVLYMSGSTDEVLAQHGLDSPGVELLEKPFTRATVLTRVRTLLDQPDKVTEQDRSPWNKFL